jgi:hypothetical protein
VALDTTSVGVSRLHAAYADIATRMAWDEMRDIVLPEACFTFDFGAGHPVVLTGPDELGDFGRRATAAFDFYCYTPLNTVLSTCGPASAAGRFYAHEVGRVDGTWLEFFGLYDDEYVVEGDRWKFARRDFRVQATRSSS